MWPNPQETTDLVTFTEEILSGKLHFLCSVRRSYKVQEDNVTILDAFQLLMFIIYRLLLQIILISVSLIQSSMMLCIEPFCRNMLNIILNIRKEKK